MSQGRVKKKRDEKVKRWPHLQCGRKCVVGGVREDINTGISVLRITGFTSFYT